MKEVAVFLFPVVKLGDVRSTHAKHESPISTTGLFLKIRLGKRFDFNKRR